MMPYTPPFVITEEILNLIAIGEEISTATMQDIMNGLSI